MATTRRTWLVKSEPSSYSYAELVKDGKTAWTGVRNFEARNNLRAMKKGDLLLYYHSNTGKEIVGLATVVREGYADPTAPPGEDWCAVEIAPLAPLAEPVTLAQVKATPALADFALIKKSRISVVPAEEKHVACILALAKTTLPEGKKAPSKKSVAKER